MNSIFWNGKRVLITGHTGFKGSWLSLLLQSLGASVTGYSLQPPTYPNLFEIADVGLGMNNIIGDIRDLNKLQSVFDNFKPEVAIHMAAQSLVIDSYNNPVDTYSTNVMGTVNFLEAVRKSEYIKVAINVTSDKCYENKEWNWGYRENEPMGGYDPYSNSKGCSELISSAYRSSFFKNNNINNKTVALSTVRAGNVIGGGDWAPNRLIPDILRSFEHCTAITIRNPNSVRPWQHVLEPLRGYITLIEYMYNQNEGYDEAWNFGPNEEDIKPVGWIVDKMISLWGIETNYHILSHQQLYEANYLKLDISKARNRLNWNPSLCLEDTLRLIIEWFRHYKSKSNMKHITFDQINFYKSLIK